MRRFSTEPVPLDSIMRILEAGRWAPSGGNAQAWIFVVVRKATNLRRLQAVSPGMLGEPTAAIVLCSDQERIRASSGRPPSQFMPRMDTAIAAQNMLLMAQELGLGTCPIGSFHRQAVSLLLDLPRSVIPELIVSVGHPAGERMAPPRRPLQEIAHFERYGGKADGD